MNSCTIYAETWHRSTVTLNFLSTHFRYGWELESKGIQFHWKGVVLRMITEGVPPVMDIGT